MRNDKLNVLNFLGDGNDESFQMFIRGHLYIEALLGEIIERAYVKSKAHVEVSTMFFRKVKLVRAIGRLSESFEELLLSINQVRNRLAHRLDFSLDFGSVFEIAQKAYIAGVDFSDDRIHMYKDISEQDYGITGVISEVITNTFYQLVWNNEDLFSQDEISKLLC